MEKFREFTSHVLPLHMKDIDTDMILPAQYLTNLTRGGYGHNLFRRLRDAHPDFPLNESRYKGARIILADINFGCGSSREAAVWTIKEAGFDVVIAKSFADIFSSNAAKNGLLLITLEALSIDRLFELASRGLLELKVDLENQCVRTSDGLKAEFEIDPFRKFCFLEGVDELNYIKRHSSEIEKYEKSLSERVFLKGV